MDLQPQHNRRTHFVVPKNGLFEIPDPPLRPDYVAMRTPEKSIRPSMLKKEEVLVDKELKFFKAEDISKTKVNQLEEEPQLVFSEPSERLDVVQTSGVARIGFGSALLRFVFNLLGIFQNECDFNENLGWI
ncbi:uncharacterized protein LOC6555571 [Drosophila erecta]|uniref:Uncharacterized protein n=1 Tax=Drosophila erecta TaxID=7220 RepID=B3P9G1_DROER|nr:uncharacterized protein LOC6555571 [Drosophila erecta]EDV45457.1 uncharacterized protein Dere_GG12708 [Drosophila erecta]